MILEVGAIKIENPDAEILAEKLHELYAGINDEFIILIKSDKENDYMQTTSDGTGLFLVEYREGEAKRHYRIERLGKKKQSCYFKITCTTVRHGESMSPGRIFLTLSVGDERQSGSSTFNQLSLTKGVESAQCRVPRWGVLAVRRV